MDAIMIKVFKVFTVLKAQGQQEWYNREIKGVFND
jgi:hypothetical protein